MKHRAYSILDTAINVYSVPFFVQHEGIALRYFQTLANDDKSDVGRYPSQFHLFLVGYFDDDAGMLEMLPTPDSIGLASSYVNPREV